MDPKIIQSSRIGKVGWGGSLLNLAHGWLDVRLPAGREVAQRTLADKPGRDCETEDAKDDRDSNARLRAAREAATTTHGLRRAARGGGRGARLARDGLESGELDRVRARLAATLFREVDDVLGRTLALSVFELLHGDAALVNDLPRRLDPADVDDAPPPLRLDEKTFRFQLNEDAMATEKLAEGIRLFAADLEKLEALLAPRLG